MTVNMVYNKTDIPLQIEQQKWHSVEYPFNRSGVPPHAMYHDLHILLAVVEYLFKNAYKTRKEYCKIRKMN